MRGRAQVPGAVGRAGGTRDFGRRETGDRRVVRPFLHVYLQGRHGPAGTIWTRADGGRTKEGGAEDQGGPQGATEVGNRAGFVGRPLLTRGGRVPSTVRGPLGDTLTVRGVRGCNKNTPCDYPLQPDRPRPQVLLGLVYGRYVSLLYDYVDHPSLCLIPGRR